MTAPQSRTARFLGRPLSLWTGAISALFGAAQLLGLIHWSGDQMAGVVLAIGAVLALAAGAGSED